MKKPAVTRACVLRWIASDVRLVVEFSTRANYPPAVLRPRAEPRGVPRETGEEIRHPRCSHHPPALIQLDPPLARAALRCKPWGQHGAARNPFSPNGCSITLFIELRTRHSCLADDVVELAIGQISPVRVGQLDLLAIVDPVEAVIAVVILNPGEVSLYEVIVDLGTGLV